MSFIRTIFILAAFGLCSCAKKTRPLKVSLYPFIPTGTQEESFEILIDFIKTEFRKVEPEVELELYIDPEMDPYSPSWELDGKKLPQSSLLSREGVNLLEIDGLILGELAESGQIHKLTYDMDQFMPQAINAVTYKNEIYGVPTWTCSLFRFEKENTNSATHISSLESEWRILLLYLEAQLELGRDEFILNSVDDEAISLVRKKLSRCKGGAVEGCFGPEAKSLLEYSKHIDKENLSYIGYGEVYGSLKKHIGSETSFSAKSLSFVKSRDEHLLLSDALVVNKNNCHGDCLKDAYKFIEFFTSLKIQKAIALNHDSGNRPPRYLSSARKDFYGTKLFLDYPLYKDFYRAFSNSKAAPNYGVTQFMPMLKKNHELWLQTLNYEDQEELERIK